MSALTFILTALAVAACAMVAGMVIVTVIQNRREKRELAEFAQELDASIAMLKELARRKREGNQS